MHCQSCASVIAAELRNIPGVVEASVSLAAKTATLTYTQKPTDQAIAQAVESVGYAVGPRALEPDSSSNILSAVFTVASDINPKIFSVAVDQPYTLEIDVKEDGRGCMSSIMIPGINNTAVPIKKGTLRLSFTINRAGPYPITCAMGMSRGTINAFNAGSK